MPPSSQRIDFVNENPRTMRSTCSGRTSRTSRPAATTPRNPSRTSSSPTETPCFVAKPAAALSRKSSGGPLIHSSAVRSGSSSIRKPIRRGPTKSSLGAASKWTRASSGNCASASRHAPAGSSSQPISSSSDGTGLPFALGLQVGLRDRAGKLAHPADVRGPLGDRERAARVQQVERVRALEHLVVRRQRQAALDQVHALGLVLAEAAAQDVDGRLLEVVSRPLALRLAVHVAPGDTGRPFELERAPLPLEVQRQALEAVGH